MLPDSLRGRTLRATLAHAPAPDRVEILPDALLTVDDTGAIAAVAPVTDAALAEAGPVVTLPDDCLLVPGFVDLHIHAPQHPQLGLALDRPLEEWLHAYTFPLEARFADLAFARRAYGRLVADLLSNGTTTAVMFATLHVEATVLLAELALAAGLRALVGKVAMDCPQGCPEHYRDASPEAAVEGTAAVLDRIRALPGNAGLVEGVVTPRFIPACTDAALEGLGALAAERGARIQTHCAESDWAAGHVLGRTGLSDAAALDRYGLVTPRAVLAHAPFLSGADMELIAARRAVIAHCPLSNAYFAGAVFPLRAAMQKGLRVGLGTDISGGPAASMLAAARMAVAASRMLETGTDPALPPDRRGRPGSAIDWRCAFHLATAGGAAALDLPVGLFAPGRRLDALVLHAPPAEPFDSPEQRLARALHMAGREDIRAVYTEGLRRHPVTGV
jgi:guanine deaminase